MRLRIQIFTLLLLFANILLLAHSMVPHIHHDGIICMSNNEVGDIFSDTHDCNSYDCTWKHAAEEEKDHHHSNTEDCDLPNLLQRSERVSDNAIDSITVLSLLYITLPDHAGCFCFSSHLLEKKKAEMPYIDNYVSPFVGSIRSLRAPPIYFLG